MQERNENDFEREPLNLAIVGGGRTCQFFLDFLRKEPFPYLNIRILGVCDIDPEAEGLLLAKDMGLFTTQDFHDLLKIQDLNFVLELTSNREVLLELIRIRPKGVGVLENNIGRLFRRLFLTNQGLKLAEQKFAREKMVSDFLIHQINERVVVLNPDFTIAEANGAYLKAVGKSRQEVLSSHCYEITHGLDAPCSSTQPALGCPMIETLRTGESAQVIHEHPASQGTATYCDMVTYPVKDQNGEIIRVLEIWRDITEELSPRWEKRVKTLKDDLSKLVQEDRMISLGRLAASCVHEINNPIQGLMTFSDLMLDILKKDALSRDDLDEFRRYVALMSNELERCGNIISGLLSFSRHPVPEYKEIDLNEILEAVIGLTRHKMELQDIRVSKHLCPDPLMVRGDINQLQQCLLNLIFNAIEAMPEGGELNVMSEADSAREEAGIEIRDTGCGIREKDLENIFDPFFTTREDGQGTGLGLSIVYGVVKMHSGEIRVKSEVDKGSAFILRFPLHRTRHN